MTKTRPTIGSCRWGRIGSCKSGCRIPKRVILVQASFNNTIVTVADVLGPVVSWSFAGTCRFRRPRKGTPFAAQTTTGNAIRIVVDQGMKWVEVRMKGAGIERDAVSWVIRKSGILVSSIHDITLLPHNGCRPSEKRCV